MRQLSVRLGRTYVTLGQLVAVILGFLTASALFAY